MRSEALLDDYITALAAGPQWRIALSATAIRNRSVAARPLLARAALRDAGTLDGLIAAARAGDRRWLVRIRRRIDAAMLAALAQTIALQDIEPDDGPDALAIYDLIRTALGPAGLTPANQALHAQLALAVHPGKARDLLAAYPAIRPDVRTGIEVDLLNPFVADRPAEPWLAAFRRLLPPPWPALDGPASLVPFDRLTPGAPAARVDAPQRVSVVVTAYRPGEGLLTAVRSIVAQTWSNIEVVLVDDGSPAEFDDVLVRATELGDRIRLIRLPGNSGTYAARNAGLNAAGGEFVTFQDSDDWSHPRRLQEQVEPLLADRSAVATTSNGLAVTDDFRLTRPGIRSDRLNPSSLLFRRTKVVGRIGYFDRVRKGADSEYIGRIQVAFGRSSVRHVESVPADPGPSAPSGGPGAGGRAPLALIRLSADSLSRAEIKAHWMHPARVAYSSAYLRWHHLIGTGAARAYRPADGADRPFAAPAHLLGAGGPRAYDVIVVADWRFLDGAQRTAVDEIRAMTGAGLRVAIAQLQSYRTVHLRRSPLCGPIQQLVNDGVIDHVLPAERADAGLLIVRQAAVLQFAPAATTGLRGRRAIVVADRAPARDDGSDRRYAPDDCTAAARRLFDTEVTWCPQDAGVRAVLRTEKVTDADLPTTIDASGWTAQRAGVADGPPIAGTDLCDADDVLTGFRAPAGLDVRVRLPDRPQWTLPAPSSWLVFPAADVDARAFLHQLDFYLHFPHPRAPEVYSRPALEAAGLGAVVVLPERFAALYGDAAVYAEPDQAADVIEGYRGDPARYAEQSRRARAVIAKAHHPGLFLDRITKWLP